MAERGRRRSAKVYTRTGDDGTTSLGNGTRVRKDDRRLEACGTVDELNAAVGVAVAHLKEANLGSGAEVVERELESIQQNLCTIETLLLSPMPGPETSWELAETVVESLEKSIDRMNTELPPLRQFIIPGGGPVAAQLHVCRTICRRAERRCVSPAATHEVPGAILRCLNRLGDYFFVAARWAARRSGENEKPRQRPS